MAKTPRKTGRKRVPKELDAPHFVMNMAENMLRTEFEIRGGMVGDPQGAHNKPAEDYKREGLAGIWQTHSRIEIIRKSDGALFWHRDYGT